MALALAEAKCDIELVKLPLIEAGAEITTKDRDGHTPLMRAVICICQEAAEVLLLDGAGVGCTDNAGDTPLIWAVQLNTPKCVKILLAHGANINTRDRTGNTPLILAAQNRHGSEVVQILLEFLEARNPRSPP